MLLLIPLDGNVIYTASTPDVQRHLQLHTRQAGARKTIIYLLTTAHIILRHNSAINVKHRYQRTATDN